MFIIQGCTEDIVPPPGEEAKLMTIDEIKTTKGFTWFQTGYDKYTFDTNLVNEIKSKLVNTDKTFLVFVNPSCACTGTQEHFPAVVKILRNAGIDEPKFKVYTMPYPDMKNPYTNIFKINYLPAFFIMKDNIALKSVFDSLSFYRQSGSDVTIEESFLKCLK
jgi:hypothetical protein